MFILFYLFVHLKKKKKKKCFGNDMLNNSLDNLEHYYKLYSNDSQLIDLAKVRNLFFYLP